MGWLLRWLDRMLGSDVLVVLTDQDKDRVDSMKPKSSSGVYRFQPAERPRGPMADDVAGSE